MSSAQWVSSLLGWPWHICISCVIQVRVVDVSVAQCWNNNSTCARFILFQHDHCNWAIVLRHSARCTQAMALVPNCCSDAGQSSMETGLMSSQDSYSYVTVGASPLNTHIIDSDRQPSSRLNSYLKSSASDLSHTQVIRPGIYYPPNLCRNWWTSL